MSATDNHRPRAVTTLFSGSMASVCVFSHIDPKKKALAYAR